MIAPNGYTCACGAWVAYGSSHACGQQPIPPTYAPPYIDNAILERIAKALEAIVEKMSEK